MKAKVNSKIAPVERFGISTPARSRGSNRDSRLQKKFQIDQEVDPALRFASQMFPPPSCNREAKPRGKNVARFGPRKKNGPLNPLGPREKLLGRAGFLLYIFFPESENNFKPGFLRVKVGQPQSQFDPFRGYDQFRTCPGPDPIV